MRDTVIPVFFDTDSSAATPYREVLKGIKNAALKGGMRICTVSEHELTDYSFENAAEAAIVASDSLPFVRSAITLLRSRSRQTVLAGLDSEQFGMDISCATPSRRAETQQVVNYLYSIGCRQIALVGFGVHSINDTIRYHAAMSAITALGLPNDERDVWRWHTDPGEVLGSFIASAHSYQAAICPNDSIAIQLIKLCRRHGIHVPKELCVCSFGDKVTGRYYSPSITTMSMDYFDIGEHSFYAWQILSRQPADRRCAVKLTVPGRLLIRESTGGRLPEATAELPLSRGSNDPFYSVPLTRDLATLENCLSQCDDLDMRIIALLMDGHSYEAIAEKLFISESALKYRLNKVFSAVGAQGKSSFIRFVQEQLDSENPFRALVTG